MKEGVNKPQTPPSDTKGSSSKEMMKSTLLFSQHWRISLMVALISVGSIALLAYLGSRLDLYLGTYPAFLIFGLIVSFPLSQLVIYKWIKKSYIPRVKKLS